MYCKNVSFFSWKINIIFISNSLHVLNRHDYCQFWCVFLSFFFVPLRHLNAGVLLSTFLVVRWREVPISATEMTSRQRVLQGRSASGVYTAVVNWKTHTYMTSCRFKRPNGFLRFVIQLTKKQNKCPHWIFAEIIEY